MGQPTIEIPAGTVEPILNQVVSETDLTQWPVKVGMSPDNSEPAEWFDAEWTVDGDVSWLYPGDAEPGVYAYWVWVDGTTMDPKRRTGWIRFT